MRTAKQSKTEQNRAKQGIAHGRQADLARNSDHPVPRHPRFTTTAAIISSSRLITTGKMPPPEAIVLLPALTDKATLSLAWPTISGRPQYVQLLCQ